MHTNLQLPAEMNHCVGEGGNRNPQESNALNYSALLGSTDVMFPEQINYLKTDVFVVKIQSKNCNVIMIRIEEVHMTVA